MATAEENNNTLFATLGLSDTILKALKDKNYELATPIQKALIPVMFTSS